MIDTPVLMQGDARALPLPDESVDLVVTSPPYFGLRDYGYDGQIGGEPTPREFVDALVECTREMARVLKPSGSVFVNLGDKYSTGNSGQSGMAALGERYRGGGHSDVAAKQRGGRVAGMPPKSLLMVPERYRIACVDELGLIARAVIIWSKPNGLPESVTDRVRRSHEEWVHLTKSPRYFSAVDEIREPHTYGGQGLTYAQRVAEGFLGDVTLRGARERDRATTGTNSKAGHSLGKLPGSVWTVATQPLHVPAELNTDHFAAFPMEWPRRLVAGWSPRHVCVECGEGRRPAVDRDRQPTQRTHNGHGFMSPNHGGRDSLPHRTTVTITGEACACADTSAPTTPGVVLDPFGGTGTTALVAHMAGRRGISVDLSTDYQRIARWRCRDPKERARAAGLDPDAVARVRTPDAAQASLFDGA